MKQKLFILLFCLVCFGLINNCNAAEYGFGKSRFVNKFVFGTQALGEQIVQSGNNVYVVSEGGNILVSKSTDGGKTFLEPIDIGSGGNSSIALNKDGIIYVVFSSYDGGASRIFITKSTDGAQTFTPRTYVCDGNFADMSVDDNGDLYIAGGGYGSFTVFKSTDGGLNFSTLNTPFSGSGDTEAIIAKGGKLYITWVTYYLPNKVLFTQSNDGGLTFSEVSNVSENFGSVSSYSTLGRSGPRLAVDGNSNVYIAWADLHIAYYKHEIRAYYKSENLYVAKKTNGSGMFTVKRIETGDFPLDPSMATDQAGNIYLSWSSQGPSGTDIWFTQSDNGGEIFASATRVSQGYPNTGYTPSLTINNVQDALVVYSDYSAPRGTYISKSSHCTD